MSWLKKREKLWSVFRICLVCLFVQESENTRWQCRQYPSRFIVDVSSRRTSQETKHLRRTEGKSFGERRMLIENREVILFERSEKGNKWRGNVSSGRWCREEPLKRRVCTTQTHIQQSIHDIAEHLPPVCRQTRARWRNCPIVPPFSSLHESQTRHQRLHKTTCQSCLGSSSGSLSGSKPGEAGRSCSVCKQMFCHWFLKAATAHEPESFQVTIELTGQTV